MKAVLAISAFRNTLYFSTCRNSRSYMALTVLSTAKAILCNSPGRSETTVCVDGLPKSRLNWFATELRRLCIRIRKVMGVRREESDALIRLADACCGFVRLASLGNRPHAVELFERAKKDDYLKEV